MVFGAVCAALPDLDVVTRIAGEWASLLHHRGVTHSLLVLPLMAPLFGWIGYRWAKQRTDYRGWTHLALWALLSHPLLDACTSYGTQLLYPLNTERYAIDAISIVDPLYSLPLLGAVLLGRRLEVRQAVARRVAIAVLTATTAYLALGCWQAQRAIAYARAPLEAGGFRPEAMRSFPTHLNIWLRRVVARNADGELRIGFVSTLAPGPMHFVAAGVEDDPLVRSALATPRGRIFSWVADGFVSARVERDDAGATVHLGDQRYGLLTAPTRAMMGAEARFDAAGSLISVDRSVPRFDFDFGAELWMAWRWIWGVGQRAVSNLGRLDGRWLRTPRG